MPDGYMAKMRPYCKTLGDPKNLKVDVNEGFDGSAWEYYSDPGVVLRTVGAAAAATRHGTELIDSLADAGMLGARIELAGEEPFASKPAYKLHVTLADGFEKDLFVDKQSFLILGDRRAAPVHAFGTAVQSENRFGDYRPVNGVLFPFTIQEVEIATGRELNSVTMQSITVNENFALSYFSPPQFERTPLQRMLEQLYNRRREKKERLRKLLEEFLLPFDGILKTTYKMFTELCDERELANLEYDPGRLQEYFSKLPEGDPRKKLWKVHIELLQTENRKAQELIDRFYGQIVLSDFTKACDDFRLHAKKWEAVWNALAGLAPMPQSGGTSGQLYAPQFPPSLEPALQAEIREVRRRLGS
jgi:hypothetical protein